jgi:hypothetical protein
LRRPSRCSLHSHSLSSSLQRTHTKQELEQPRRGFLPADSDGDAAAPATKGAALPHLFGRQAAPQRWRWERRHEGASVRDVRRHRQRVRHVPDGLPGGQDRLGVPGHVPDHAVPDVRGAAAAATFGACRRCVVSVGERHARAEVQATRGVALGVPVRRLPHAHVAAAGQRAEACARCGGGAGGGAGRRRRRRRRGGGAARGAACPGVLLRGGRVHRRRLLQGAGRGNVPVGLGQRVRRRGVGGDDPRAAVGRVSRATCQPAPPPPARTAAHVDQLLPPGTLLPLPHEVARGRELRGEHGGARSRRAGMPPVWDHAGAR